MSRKPQKPQNAAVSWAARKFGRTELRLSRRLKPARVEWILVSKWRGAEYELASGEVTPGGMVALPRGVTVPRVRTALA